MRVVGRLSKQNGMFYAVLAYVDGYEGGEWVYSSAYGSG